MNISTPTSIKSAKGILIFKLCVIGFVLLLATILLSSSNLDSEFLQGAREGFFEAVGAFEFDDSMALILIWMVLMIPLTTSGLTLLFIYKKKRIPALIFAGLDLLIVVSGANILAIIFNALIIINLFRPTSRRWFESGKMTQINDLENADILDDFPN